MKKLLYAFLAVASLGLASCDDMFEPAKQNFKDLGQMETEPDFAMGFLTRAYSSLSGYYANTEYATDNAVVNQNSEGFRTMATGGWTASSWTGITEWSGAYTGIQYINQFLAKIDDVEWSADPERRQMLAIRLRGEAHGLRGILHYQLLKAHSGYNAAGELLGVPYLESYLGANDDMNAAMIRPSFKDCVDKIKADLNVAIETLPLDYEDVAEVPEKYQQYTLNPSTYNRAMGAHFRQLVSGRIARAYLSRLALLAASDGFGNTLSWADAATAAADLLKENDGVDGVKKGSYEYYLAKFADTLKDGINPDEIIWRENMGDSNNTESENLPPSLNGNGRMNPSQNLVDAFPTVSGYPIGIADDYDPANPYANRDPRLSAYIIYNGAARVGVNNVTISTVSGTTDGIGGVEQRSSRTGYYMKKRLRMDVNCTPGSSTTKPHYNPRVRYTEIYLNYAEAANEAYGPKADGGNGFSAYEVIKAIRQRAGVGAANGDAYLEECAASKEKMRELIRNERRIELCFENSRFWDIRRWKLDLNETVKGIEWHADGTY
ncbi:MAG: RagB/SusD family nutrient uptake outer membrane protein, partial [Muribaculaceae bacterium]|nr:RagB/SusD family nutrient uptake outer membrane protein [Muribaculaceae bacterium]MDE6554262.1 RagB/SusD family nutrient uptake outer membrane protein [Muribaculaceae bacterium]